MQRAFSLKTDLYGDSGMYQLCFHVDGSKLNIDPDKEIIVFWYEELQKDYQFINEDSLNDSFALFFLDKYKIILSNEDPNIFTIYNATDIIKISFINLVTQLLYKVIYSKNEIIQNAAYELMNLFFKNLPLLNYNENTRNDLLDQAMIGTVRSFFLSKQHYLTAQEIKKERHFKKFSRNNK